MAIVSDTGFFELTNISFSPNVIVLGEETACSMTLRNKSGKKITELHLQLSLWFPVETGTGIALANFFGGTDVMAGSRVSWANNTEQTFTGKVTFDPGGQKPYFAGRAVPEEDPYGLRMTVRSNVRQSELTHLDRSGALHVVDAHYSPAITVFGAERSAGSQPDDEGENLIADIALKCSPAARRGYMSLHLYYGDRANPDAGPHAVNLTGLMDGALAAEIRTVVSEAFSKSSDWDVLLRFGDQYESVTAAIVLSRSFANVHLSGASTGGVAFGGFSKATEGSPLFQNYYPSVFYEPARFDKGIHGVSNFAPGEAETGGRWIDGRKIYRRVVQVNVAATDALTEIADVPGVAAMVNMYGYVTRASGTQRFPLTFWFSDSNYHSFMLNGDKLGVKTSAAISGYAVIEYTKTEEASS